MRTPEGPAVSGCGADTRSLTAWCFVQCWLLWGLDGGSHRAFSGEGYTATGPQGSSASHLPQDVRPRLGRGQSGGWGQRWAGTHSQESFLRGLPSVGPRDDGRRCQLRLHPCGLQFPVCGADSQPQVSPGQALVASCGGGGVQAGPRFHPDHQAAELPLAPGPQDGAAPRHIPSRKWPPRQRCPGRMSPLVAAEMACGVPDCVHPNAGPAGRCPPGCPRTWGQRDLI